MANAPYPLDALNLDCMMRDDLEITLAGLMLLTHYAEKRLAAIRFYEANNYLMARQCEAQCELIYSTIPDNWKW